MSTLRIKNLKCPKCGQQTLECYHWENGGPTSFNDNFRHTCTNPKCDYKKKSLDNYGGQAGYEDLPVCPMCGQTH